MSFKSNQTDFFSESMVWAPNCKQLENKDKDMSPMGQVHKPGVHSQESSLKKFQWGQKHSSLLSAFHIWKPGWGLVSVALGDGSAFFYVGPEISSSPAEPITQPEESVIPMAITGIAKLVYSLADKLLFISNFTS